MKPASTRSLAVKKSLLRARLKDDGRLLVAFSGGKDSFFLWQEANRVLGPAAVFPYFISTPFTLDSARERVAYFKEKFSVPLHEIRIDLLKDKRLRRNPRQRCYYCKTKMFSALKQEASRLGIDVIADGTTVSDLGEHRPGRRALDELAIASPLRDAGFTAAEIAAVLKRQGVAAYFLTSSTCLATRFPYDFTLSRQAIRAIGRVEHHLTENRIFPVRVRHLTGGVRIETTPANLKKLIAMKGELVEVCRAAGFRFCTLDLEGIRSGCWDEAPARAVPGHGGISK